MEEVKTEIKEALKGGSKENSMRSSKDTSSVKKNDGGSSLKNSSAASLGSNQNKITEKKKSLRTSKQPIDEIHELEEADRESPEMNRNQQRNRVSPDFSLD